MLTTACFKSNFTTELIYAALPVKLYNLDYLNGITRGDEKKASKLVAVFFTEINEELLQLNIAIEAGNHPGISNIIHKLKSAFAILGITILNPVLIEMELLCAGTSSIEIIKQRSQKLHLVFNQARIEMNLAI